MSYNPNNRTPYYPSTYFKTTYSAKHSTPIIFPADSPHTRQEFADECNINVIMSQYMLTGQTPLLNERTPQYLDVTGENFQTAMDIVANAKSLFNEMPSVIRNRFNNDPAAFLDFVNDPGNMPEMEKLGMLKPKNERVGTLSPSVPPVAPPASNLTPAPPSPNPPVTTPPE